MIGVSVCRKFLLSAFLISAWQWLSSLAFASDAPAGKPQISIEKQYVVISVTVGPALQPFAALFADCLAEGKAWANEKNSDSAAEWRDNRQSFGGMQWSYNRDYTLRSVAGRHVSVVRRTHGSTAARIRISASTQFYGTMPHTNGSAFARVSPKRPTTVRS